MTTLLSKMKNKKSIVLLHGVFDPSIIPELKKRRISEVYLLEGRPSLKAAKNFSRVLLKNKIKPVLIADNMAGFLFFRNLVKEVWIAYQNENGEGVLATIGASILAVLAKNHQVEVNLYRAGEEVKLLGREKEVFEFNGVRVAPKNIRGYVPLVETLPRKYITKIYN